MLVCFLGPVSYIYLHVSISTLYKYFCTEDSINLSFQAIAAQQAFHHLFWVA